MKSTRHSRSGNIAPDDNHCMNDKVSKAVEIICEQGCVTVNEVIRSLEVGVSIKETHEMTQTERNELLKELKEIMSVYKKK